MALTPQCPPSALLQLARKPSASSLRSPNVFLSQLSLVLSINTTWGFAAGSQSSLTPLTPAVHPQLSPLPVKTPSEGLLGTSLPTPIPSASQSLVISSLMPGPSIHPSNKLAPSTHWVSAEDPGPHPAGAQRPVITALQDGR